MLDFDKRDGQIEDGVRRRSFGLGLLRSARRAPTSFFEDATDVDDPGRFDDTVEVRARRLPRFSITRQGYDCGEVDDYVEDLERELAELDGELADMRIKARSGKEVTAELQRVGEQTSSILLAAHEKAQETMHLAEVVAGSKIADAASNAAAMTEEAKRKVVELKEQSVSLRHEHGRRIDEIQNLSTVLQSVAEAAIERMPPEPDAGQLPKNGKPADGEPPKR